LGYFPRLIYDYLSAEIFRCLPQNTLILTGIRQLHSKAV